MQEDDDNLGFAALSEGENTAGQMGSMFDPGATDSRAGGAPPWVTPNMASALGGSGSVAGGSQDTASLLENPRIKELQAKEDQLEKERKSALDPLYADVRKSINAPGPPIPSLEKAPKAPKEQLGQGAMEYMQIATIMSALAGVFARRGTTTALTAFSGAIKGFTEGNAEIFKAKSEEWKQASQEVSSNNQAKLDQYNMIWKDKKLNVDQKMENIKIVASQYGDDIAYNLANQRNYTALAQADAKQRQFQQQYDEKQKLVAKQIEMYTARIDQMKGANQDAVESAARRYILGDKTQATQMGRSVALRNQFWDAVEKIKQAEKISDQDILTNQQEFAGKQREQNVVGGRAGNIAIAVKESQKTIPLAEAANAASAKQGKRNGLAAWNKATNEWNVQKGDENFAQLVVYTNSLITVYARAQGGGGTGTVEQREHAREMLNPNQPPHTYSASLRALANDLGVMSSAPNQVREDMRNSGKEPPASAIPEPPSGGGWSIVK